MPPPTEVISLDSDSDDASPTIPRANPSSQTLHAPVNLSSDDERDDNELDDNEHDDNDDDLLEPSFADKVAALVHSRGQPTKNFPFSSRPSSAGTSSTAVVVDLDAENSSSPPTLTKPNHDTEDDDDCSPIVSNLRNNSPYLPSTSLSPRITNTNTCVILDEDEDTDFTPNSRHTAAKRKNEPASPVDIDLTLIDNNERSSSTQSQLKNWRRKKPQRGTKKKTKCDNGDAVITSENSEAENNNLISSKSTEDSDTESVTTTTGKAKRQKKRDRDDVIVVLSREFGGKPHSLEFMGKVLTTATLEKNVTSKVGDLPQPNRVEWRRCFPDRPGYAIDAVAYWYGAAEFVELMADEQIVSMAKIVRNRHPDIVVFVFVVGVSTYCRRTVRKKAASNTRVFTKEAIDDCCTALWLDYRLHVQSMDSSDEAAEQVRFLAYAVGRKPYSEELSRADLRTAYAKKKTERGNAALCPDGSGGVREETASDLGAVYQKLLALVPGCSPDKAKSIRRVYPSLKRLLDAFEKSLEPHLLLVDVQDRNGRRLGPKLAQKIWTVLGKGDPNECVS